MRDYAELVTRLKQSDDNCNAECCECSGECLSSGCNIFCEAADAIEELQARNDKQTMMIRKQSERTKELLAAVPQWISVKERLPDKHGRYLCRVQNIVRQSEYYTQVLNFEYGHFSNTVYFGGDATNENVSHWMPLPEPPMEVQDD